MAGRILIALLALSIWPGTSESVEYVVHWVQDGDSVHGRHHHDAPSSPADDDDGDGGDHLPGAGHLCHLTSSCSCIGHFGSVVAHLDVQPAPIRAASFVAASDRLGISDPLPPLRPPIS